MPRHRALRADDGFTLIELLIVVIILGILAGIVVLAVGHTRQDAARSACLADYGTVARADESYFATTSYYADTIDDLVTASVLREAPTTDNGYTIGLQYTTNGHGKGKGHGHGHPDTDPTGEVTVNGAVGPSGCDSL
jgi:general secretion pathway protein G